MSRVLYGVGRFCVRHRYRVLLAWLLAVVATVAGAGIAGEDTTNNLTLPGSDSTRAQDLLADNLPGQANGTIPVVLEAPHGTLTSGAYPNAVNATVSSLQKEPYVRSAVSPLSKKGASALSKDGRIGYISLTLNVGAGEITDDQANAVIDAESPARDAGLEVATGGYVGEEVSEPPPESSEAIGLTAAIIILLFTLGTAVAMSVPIVTALLGVVTGLSAIGLLGHIVDVPTIGPTLGAMLGLGVGIDYGLFIVSRHRGFMERGLPPDEAAARAVATAGGAVVFAGGTVVIALLSLAVAGIPIVSALGYSAAIVVVIAILTAVTLIPAALAALGHRIDAVRMPFLRTPPHDERPHGWARWARGVGRIPLPVLLIAVTLLVVLAIPLLHLKLGQEDDGQLPTSTTARQAYDLLAEGFGPGVNGPLLIGVNVGGAPASSASDPRLEKLEQDISQTTGVAAVTPPLLDSSGDAAVFTVIPTTGPSENATEDLVRDMRSSVIPRAVEGTGLTAYVGGQTAGYIDVADRISEKLPLVIGVVLALSVVLLFFAFRSLIVPLTAALMDLLSVAAAYGVLTFVFQDGHGATALGLEGATPVVSFVPLLMFAILFGLSMDYQVFLLTRVQEHYRESHDNHEAVVDGLAVSARVITAAALIMVCVFTSFVLNGDPTVKQFGLGLAVAIAVDATVVRCLLVPAVMVLLGRYNWWLPSWLSRRLPELGIEGEEFFQAQDAAAAAAAAKPSL